MSFIRCKTCVMPNQRPDVPFVDGECQACINYKQRPTIDWDARKEALVSLLDGRGFRGYDCVVASSGGKDSHYQVMALLALGARPLVVTATTCHLTALGRHNIDNLARHAATIEVSPNKTVRAKLNRLGLEMVGDISWPEHVAIFTTPLRVARQMGIPLVFYGENPQNQYGGPPGTADALTMDERWRSEFGGFLGLRNSDMVGKNGITQRDMLEYEMPQVFDGNTKTLTPGVQAHFLGQYLPWDPRVNMSVAHKAGMRFQTPSAANWWPWENLDNAQTGLHDYMMYRKYGYGRGCTQISVDIRAGLVSREVALRWVKEHDGLFPSDYAGVDSKEVLAQIGLTLDEFWLIADTFTNWDLFRRTSDDQAALPVLLE